MLFLLAKDFFHINNSVAGSATAPLRGELHLFRLVGPSGRDDDGRSLRGGDGGVGDDGRGLADYIREGVADLLRRSCGEAVALEKEAQLVRLRLGDPQD